MRKLTTLLLLAITIVGATAAHAIEKQTTTGNCLINGQSSVCSESYTRLSFIEAAQIDIVHVRGIFAGPGYTADLTKDSTVSVLVPSSWTAKVEHNVCARSGAYSASGTIGLRSCPAVGIQTRHLAFSFNGPVTALRSIDELEIAKLGLGVLREIDPIRDLQYSYAHRRRTLVRTGVRSRKPYCARHSSVSWNLMIGKHPLWVTKQHGHSIATMPRAYAA